MNRLIRLLSKEPIVSVRRLTEKEYNKIEDWIV